MSTNPASYPLQIVVGAEAITLQSPPGGGTSPQAYTGIVRGAAGTVPAAQAAGAAVSVNPPSAVAL
jgi:hypothetical protein